MNQDFRDESFGLDTTMDDIDEALADAMEAQLLADAAIKRMERRLLTQFEVARFHAVRPRACPTCHRIRIGSLFRDGRCLWCRGEMNPDEERTAMEDRAFLRVIYPILGKPRKIQ